jgi:hypothetical protein
MSKFRALFLICGLAIFGVGVSNADSLTEYFTYGVVAYPPDYNFVIGSVSPTEGQITLNTNADGTITATLTDYYATINEIGFNYNNSCVNGFCVGTQYTSSTFTGWGTMGNAFGTQHLGFWCDDPTTGYPTDCGTQSVTWTIYANNELFTSVYQLLGGTSSSADFALFDNNWNNGNTNNDPVGWYGAGMPPYTPSSSTTPEPGTFLLLATGLAGTLGAIRRKLRV